MVEARCARTRFEDYAGSSITYGQSDLIGLTMQN